MGDDSMSKVWAHPDLAQRALGCGRRERCGGDLSLATAINGHPPMS
jgi:hypothetical protein